MKAAPIKNLSELKRLKQEIERQAKVQAEQEAARLQAQRLAQAQQQLFARSVGPVRPLASKHRQSRPVAAAPPQPVPVQHRLDE
jgi:uncharacterized protein YgbK (DUF1537 family)